MYIVSDEYSENIAKNVRYTAISGYVQLKDGTMYPISDDNIVENSLQINKSLNTRGVFSPGGAFAAELSVSLLGFKEITKSLDGALIVPFFDLFRTSAREEYDRVPLGMYYVDGSKTERKSGTVRLKAYDGLLKFDMDAQPLSGTLYELLETACSACNVLVGITQEEFEALPNGNMTVAIDTARIQTWRDFLSYLGMLTGCFCRMSRTARKLEIVPLTCSHTESGTLIADRHIEGNIRFATDFSDDVTHITRLTMRHNGELIASTKKIDWVGGSITLLAQLELPENPLLSGLSETEVITALNNIIMVITQCALRPYHADITGDPALDIGDYVMLSGGEVDTEREYFKGLIGTMTWKYRGKHRIKCLLPTLLPADAVQTVALSESETDTPIRTQPKSQTEKRIDALEKGLQQCTTSTAIAPLTAYELLSDTSVKCNDITYTIETDSATGLISKITDSLGGKLVPTYKATPTDVDSHNFMLWAVAMARGLSSTYLEPIVIFNYGNIVGLNPDFSDYGVRSGDHFSVTDEEMVLTHFLTDSGLHANNYVAFHTPILNVGYTKLRVTYEVEKVHSDWNVFIIDAGYAVNENGYNIDDDFGYTELVIWTGNNVSVPKTTVDIDISESIGKEIYVGFRHNCNNSHIYSLALVQ